MRLPGSRSPWGDRPQGLLYSLKSHKESRGLPQGAHLRQQTVERTYGGLQPRWLIGEGYPTPQHFWKDFTAHCCTHTGVTAPPGLEEALRALAMEGSCLPSLAPTSRAHVHAHRLFRNAFPGKSVCPCRLENFQDRLGLFGLHIFPTCKGDLRASGMDVSCVPLVRCNPVRMPTCPGTPLPTPSMGLQRVRREHTADPVVQNGLKGCGLKSQLWHLHPHLSVPAKQA